MQKVYCSNIYFNVMEKTILSIAMVLATIRVSCSWTCHLQELSDWNVRYKQKFGFIFIICASGRTSSEILAELKVNLVVA